jgi:hypothetical protein
MMACRQRATGIQRARYVDEVPGGALLKVDYDEDID